jgi:hypothetical protein
VDVTERGMRMRDEEVQMTGVNPTCSVTSRRRRVGPLALAAVLSVGLLAMGAVPASASSNDLTCSGGDFSTFTPAVIPSGIYHSITVTGFCAVASGATITVQSGLRVASHGFLVASGALDNQMDHPDCNRSITIGGGVQIDPAGSLILGDGEGSGCVPSTHTTVSGGVKANAPLDLIVHGVTVNGGYSLLGGGDGLPCNFAGLPTYTTLEDSNVNGGVTISGYKACWLGFARDHVNGGVTLKNNALDDPDAMEILSNSINGGLACFGNTAGGVPRATNQGDVGPDGSLVTLPNTVHGAETGQCVGL